MKGFETVLALAHSHNVQVKVKTVHLIIMMLISPKLRTEPFCSQCHKLPLLLTIGKPRTGSSLFQR